MDERIQQRARDFALLDEAGKSSFADRDFFHAAKEARLSVEDEGLWSWIGDQNEPFSKAQAVKAACMARQDVAHVLIVQRQILKRLDRNRNYMWAIITILGYIAIQLG